MDADTLTSLRAIVDRNRIRILGRLATHPADAESLAEELRLPVHVVRKQLEVLVHAGLVEPRPERLGAYVARPENAAQPRPQNAAEPRPEPATATGPATGPDPRPGPRAATRPDHSGAYTARLDRLGRVGRELATLEREASGTLTGPEGAWPHDGESLADTLVRLAPTPDEAKVLRSYLVDGRLTTIPAQHAKRQIVLRFLLERVFTEDRDYPEKEVNQRLALFHADVASLRRYLFDDRYLDREAGLYRRRPVDPPPTPGTPT
jgi:DNA-binding transcriptional ArsR family regulator